MRFLYQLWKLKMSNESSIKLIKLSDYLKIDFDTKSERIMLRLTGSVDPDKSNSKQLLLFSLEENEANKIIQRYEVNVDLSYLNDFNLSDIHLQHDLIQFIGYKDPTNTKNNFRALYFRLLKRTSLKNYYAAIDIQNRYLNQSKEI